MKKLISCFLALAVLMLSHAAFAQDSAKHSSKASKMVTKKTTVHHKMVKKTKPAM